MARTRDEWLAKIKSFLPAWWFEEEEHQTAVLTGIAAVAAEIDQENDNYFNETMLLTSSAPVIDSHGDERSVERIPNELDPPYAQRVRHLVNQSNPVAIKEMVDKLLVKGECTIQEHRESLIFAGQSFLNRHEVFTDDYWNISSIVVDKQIHAPYSFLSRENFASRGDFMGTSESPIDLFNQIVAAVNRNKAFGTLYRVTETDD